jgi:hypothetical protein
MGDPIGGLRWRFIWYVHCPAGTTGVMEPIFQRYKPAHTEVFFVEDL